MKHLLGALLIFVSINSFSQNVNNYYLADGETYVLKTKIIKKIEVGKPSCSFGKRNKCDLYKISVTDVLFCPKNTFADSLRLLSITYMIVPVETDINISDSILTITARPSDSKLYLAFSKILSQNSINNISFKHQHAYLSGIIVCKKKTYRHFEKLIKD